MTIRRKFLSAASLRTSKWFLTRMPSEMSNQCCSRREIFTTPWLSASVSLRLFPFLLVLAHTYGIPVIAVCIYILISISVVTLAFLC
jgi:hypothetical protein